MHRDVWGRRKRGADADSHRFQASKISDTILAFTDLHLVMPQNAGVKIHDTMEILALTSAEIMSE